MSTLKTYNFTADLTSCEYDMFVAREKIAQELRRIADDLDAGDTLGESGHMTICDYGKWAFPQPKEEGGQ